MTKVAAWTFCSRVLGLLRDVLLFAALGTGALNSAFILAFTLPNLFRRLLGEGALASSSIPVLSETLAKAGRQAAFGLLNGLMARLGLGLLVLTVLALPLFYLGGQLEGYPDRWLLGAGFSQVVFPYVILICLGALVCGMLNVLDRFGVAAFNQVWLNLTMIASLVAGLLLLPAGDASRAWWLCYAVLLGGVLQLVIPTLALKREGWDPHLRPEDAEGLRKVLRLFLPGLLGAAIFQLNILVSRLLAFSLDDTATGLLYLASRLVELPLGVFAIAITTVVFPQLARLSAMKSSEAFAETFSRGWVLILSITLPAALGLGIMAGPVLSSLFEWGLFEASDVRSATPVLMMAATGLPFFAWSNLLTRAWYARQQMRLPVILAAVNLILNLVLGLIFMQVWGAVGLALANTLSAAVHALALQIGFPGRILLPGCWRALAQVSASLAVLALVGLAGYPVVASLALASGKAADLLLVLFWIPVTALAYGLALHLTGFPYLTDFLPARRRRRTSPD